MKDFFNKTWVKITSWVFIVIGSIVLLIGGTKVEDITKVPELVFGILEAVGALILFIKGLLAKKDSK